MTSVGARDRTRCWIARFERGGSEAEKMSYPSQSSDERLIGDKEQGVSQ
jgi:hypothetical protein